MFKVASNFWKCKCDIAEVSWNNNAAVPLLNHGVMVFQRWADEQLEDKGYSKTVIIDQTDP